MFLGTVYSKIENKGRFLIPKNMRKEIKDWVITLGLENNLALYKKDDFQKEIKKMKSLHWNNKISRDYIRLFLNLASEVTTDSLGRILIPNVLSEKVVLQKDVVVVGSGHLIELWNQSEYHKYWQELEKRRQDLAEKVEFNHA